MGRALLLGVMIAALAACAGCGAAGVAGSTLQVVAAEDVWGSIAAQLGGTHVSVTSIVTDPNADPHEYETTTADARAFATADYVIVNGAGYDDWAQKMLDANPSSTRVVLDVGALVHEPAGANPHLWYSPAFVSAVMTRITGDYEHLDPHDTAAFATAHTQLDAAMGAYRGVIAGVAAQHRGAPIAATEPVAGYLASAMGLDVVSPDAFMHAVEEGSDPPAQAVAAFQQQVTQHQVRLLIDNVQTTTPLTGAMVTLAQQSHVPVVGVSEILQPAGARFQDWMYTEVLAVQRALQQG